MRIPNDFLDDDGRSDDEEGSQERRREQIKALNRSVDKAIGRKNWAKAMHKLQGLIALDPADEEAKSKLTVARDEEARRLYTQGRVHLEAGSWREALDCLRQVALMNEHYDDISKLIGSARKRLAEELGPHFSDVTTALEEEPFIPFLGAGVNFCGRPKRSCYRPGRYLPNSIELTEYLLDGSSYPREDVKDLLRVSQYIDVTMGSKRLYRKLRELFNKDDYMITPLHRFLAELPALLSKRRCPQPHQLIVTTNYDNVLERAFDEKKQPYDVVWYMAEGELSGKCFHRKPDGEVNEILKPNEYQGLDFDQRGVILKVHGAVNKNKDHDSFVITEDNYIDYLTQLTQTDLNNLFPAQIMARFRESHFLFLGYAMRDWNLRVLLYRIWKTEAHSSSSWAIQRNPQRFDEKYWQRHKVEILNVDLEDYISILSDHLRR